MAISSKNISDLWGEVNKIQKKLIFWTENVTEYFASYISIVRLYVQPLENEIPWDKFKKNFRCSHKKNIVLSQVEFLS